MHCTRTLVSSDLKTQEAVVDLVICNEGERRDIRGLVHMTLRMRFRTPPYLVAYFFANHVAVRGHTGSIFDISELDLRDIDSIVVLVPVDLHFTYTSWFTHT